MKEEDMNKIVDMLMAGGKMLSIHCAKCMSPLFDYKGKVVCPVCGGETKLAEEKGKTPPTKKLEEALRSKIDLLTEQLAKETDHEKTLEILEQIKAAGMKVQRDAILRALREAGTPITIEELSKRTGMDVIRLRVDLFKLMSEGLVEKRTSGNTVLWTISVRPRR